MKVEINIAQEEIQYPSNEVLKNLFEKLSNMPDRKKSFLSPENTNVAFVIQSVKKRNVIFSIQQYGNLVEDSEYCRPHNERMYFLKKRVGGKKFNIEAVEGISFSGIPLEEIQDFDKDRYLNESYRAYIPTESEVQKIKRFFDDSK
ncbi:hypothetical protein M1145_02610 [Patescibacteria group bacterium]|nr:hypothetical protein [Patescibacteria group bacterium]